MKAGIIKCMQIEDYCSGTTDFRMIREKKGAFEGIDKEIEVIGFINCGGCPGKGAVLRVRELVKQGMDTTVLTSCIQKETPIGYPYSFTKRMKEIVQMDPSDTIKYLDFTY